MNTQENALLRRTIRNLLDAIDGLDELGLSGAGDFCEVAVQDAMMCLDDGDELTHLIENNIEFSSVPNNGVGVWKGGA